MNAADLNAALAEIRDHLSRGGNATGRHARAILDAIPEGAVLVAITRDDLQQIRPSTALRREAWAALEAQS